MPLEKKNLFFDMHLWYGIVPWKLKSRELIFIAMCQREPSEPLSVS